MAGGFTARSRGSPNRMMQNSHQQDERKVNDIRSIKHPKTLDRLFLDFESPRMKEAMSNLGVTFKEMRVKGKKEFEKKGVEKDLAELRYNHYRERLLDLYNRVLEERHNIKVAQHKRALSQSPRNLSVFNDNRFVATLSPSRNIKSVMSVRGPHTMRFFA